MFCLNCKLANSSLNGKNIEIELDIIIKDLGDLTGFLDRYPET